jgi:hypothetical protein
LLRKISRNLAEGPFAIGFTDATSNCGLAGGVCAGKVVQIKAIAAHTTYRIVNLLALCN